MSAPPFWIGLLILGISVVLHEWGHIVLMQRLKIFKGMAFRWWGVECLVDKEADVKLTMIQGLNLYLVGFVLSLIPFPIWILVGGSWFTFLGYNVIASMLDFKGAARLILKRKMLFE